VAGFEKTDGSQVAQPQCSVVLQRKQLRSQREGETKFIGQKKGKLKGREDIVPVAE